MSRRGLSRPLGFSTLEVVVACTLLSGVVTLSAPLIVAHNRLLKSQRDYRLALSELSNQFERLSLSSVAELPAAVENVAPSAFARQHLPEAKLRGKVRADELGRRVTLELTWDEPNRAAAPVQLTGWFPATEAAP